MKYKLIPLTHDQFAKVDPEDYGRLTKFRWNAFWNNKRRYYRAIRHCYDKNTGKWKNVYMSREVMGSPKDLVIDHVNHDTLDNRKSNLRPCRPKDNLRNKKRHKDNTSGFTGVCRAAHGSKSWEAKIGVSGKSIYLGSFRYKAQAAIAYNEAAIRYFGEFSCLNVLPPQSYLP